MELSALDLSSLQWGQRQPWFDGVVEEVALEVQSGDVAITIENTVGKLPKKQKYKSFYPRKAYGIHHSAPANGA